MNISEMLANENVKPMMIFSHPDLTRAAFLLRSHGYPTPMDSILREQREITAVRLHKLGM